MSALEIIFLYVMPIISFAMGVYLFVRFYSMKDLVDKDTVRLIKQIKTWWGSSQATERWKGVNQKKAYKSGSQKVGKRIKTLVPFGILDELTEEEVHAYIMNEDTINFFIKLRSLIGGDFKLPGMPDIKLPGRSKKEEFGYKNQ